MKEYFCKKVCNEIIIDGNIEKDVWKEVEGVELQETASGEKPKQQTFVKLLYDDKNLYVTFRCMDDEINAELTEYNDLIYNEEVVEIFIDTDCDLKTYIEIEVSPINTLLHYAIRNNLKGDIKVYARVQKVIESQVVHNEKEGIWDVEIKIPFTELTLEEIPPKARNAWLINLYRIDRRKKGEDEYSAWCPTGEINFHKPDKFGKLIFE